PPPLSLSLFYLMTPYATNDPQSGNAAAHEILGDAMRVFYEHPIVPSSYLADGLKDATEQIKIMLDPVNVDELSQVWHTFTQPFRLSILYEISVVQLDALPAAERSMAPRVRKVGVPDVRAPFQPPAVDGIDPSSGRAGSVLGIHGHHLNGWRAS